MCVIYDCEATAVGRYTWGPYPAGDRNGRVPLCQDHAAELWGKVAGLVTAQLFHFAIEPVEAAQGQY